MGTYVFIFLAVVVLLIIVGWPLWLLIWAFKEKKKSGKFPWKKFLVTFVILFLVGGIIRSLANRYQENLINDYGVESIGGEIDIEKGVTR
jgi:RsiW-degrading membrane proteinase PrsW (M82 family)